jgi:aromatic-L-amino-acid/L-tryptophan decarboxylase
VANGSLPEPVQALFPRADERRRVDDLLTLQLGAAAQRVAHGSVVPTLDIDAFDKDLAGFDFAEPRSLDDLLSWIMPCMEHGVVHITHPRYFGLFNPPPTFPAQCADRITTIFNPQLASSASSPVPVALEAHMIRAVGARAGLGSDAAGHFATGASEANFTALVCALTRAHPRFASEGVRAFPGPVTFYASNESHITWLKVAHETGVGRDALRTVATDGHGRMDVDALRQAIVSDRAKGCVPVMIAATAGTTVAGMVDPLEACAQVARTEDVWYHVDAAWGGAAIASDSLRGVLTGLELADSITIDAHKWFATTMGCAMFIVREGGRGGRALLSETFHTSTTYMPSNVTTIDPYLNSVQWSRRFLGLRLFLSLGVAGWEGYGRHVERALEVIARVREGLVARGWKVVNDSRLAVLCVVPPSGRGAPKEIRERVLASGRAWVSAPHFEGSDVIRICATSGETTLSDVGELISTLEGA